MAQATAKKSRLTLVKALPWILVIGGIVGLIASGILTYDHNKLAVDPNYIPSCNLNPIIACGTVVKSKQAEAFHFPNPYIGLVAFPMLIAAGMSLFAGGKFKRWWWLALNAGALFGLLFVHWLFYETVYRIHALCPYCMVVWAVTIPTFWYVTLYNIDNQYIRLPRGRAQVAYAWVRRHHLDLLVLWFLIIAGLILKHFWYYYGQHFF